MLAVLHVHTKGVKPMGRANGYAKFDRRFWVIGDLFNENNHNTLAVYAYLILHANYATGNINGREIHKGQLVTSAASIAEKINLSRSQVRTALKHLEDEHFISIKAYKTYSVVKIIELDFSSKKPKETEPESNTNPEMIRARNQ